MIDNFSGNVHLQTKLREIVEKAVCVALCGFKLGAFLKKDTSSSKWFLQVPFCVFTTVLQSRTHFQKKSTLLKNGHFSWVLKLCFLQPFFSKCSHLFADKTIYWIKTQFEWSQLSKICLLRTKTCDVFESLTRDWYRLMKSLTEPSS